MNYFYIFLGFSVIQYLFSIWIKYRLEQSIIHEYQKILEDYRFSLKQREEITKVSAFFSKWIKYRGNEDKILKNEELFNYYEELNKMSLELSLRISEEETLLGIMKRLKKEDGSKDIRTLIGDIRKIILNKPSDTFNPQDIVLWPNKEIEDRIFK